ncbi:MAG: rRNA maturation RNAse YbeY, partial [Oscillospiraceae bacterium]
MKLSILNQQDNLKVTKSMRDLIKASAKATLLYMHFRTDVEISVMLTNNDEIKTLNHLHRNINSATDV